MKKNNTAIDANKNNEIYKNVFSIPDTAMVIFLITICGYSLAYISEWLDAIFYHFDVDFISISVTTLIKNNLFFILSFAVISLCFLLENKENKENKSISKIDSFITKNSGKIIWIILFFWIVIVSFIIYQSPFFSYYTFIGIGLFIVYILLSQIQKEKSNKNRIAVLILITYILIPIITIYKFTFNSYILDEFKAFNYNHDNYILLKQYNDTLIAKKINIVLGTNNKYYTDITTDENNILYLPISVLNEGINFYSVKKIN